MGDRPKINSASTRLDDRAVHSTPAPLLWPVLAFALGIVAAETSGLEWPGLILIAIPAGLAATIAFAPRGIIPALVMATAFFVGLARHQAGTRLDDDHIARFLNDAPTLTRVTGRIVTTPVRRPAVRLNPFLPTEPKPRVQFLIEASDLLTTEPPTAVSGFVRVAVEADDLPLRMGDVITITGWIYRPRPPRNPGGIDWAATLRLEGVYAGMKAPGPQYVTRVEQSASSWWHASRDRLRAWSRSLLFEPYAGGEDEDARSLLDAIVLGQRSAVSRELNQAFVRTGAMHFLAVSGFHVGVLAGSFWFFTRRILRRSEFTAGLVTILILAVYLLVVEHNAPVLRATIMGIFVCLARMRGRPFSVFNWLALSAACLLIYNPLELFRPGFQLSFLLITALVTVVPRTHARLTWRSPLMGPPVEPVNMRQLIAKSARNLIISAAVVNACAWVVALPLVAFHFGRFAPFGAIQSFLLTPIVIGVIVSGFLSIVLAPWIGPGGVVVDAGLRFFTDSLLWSVDLLSQLPGAILETSPRPAWMVVTLYAAAIAFIGLRRIRRPRQVLKRTSGVDRYRPALRVAAGTGFVLAAGLWAWHPHRSDDTRAFELHVLAVGNGSATILTTPDRHAMLFDAGTLSNWDVGRSIARGLKALRVRTLDFITVSHANFDHYSGIPSLLESVSADALIVSEYFPLERAGHPSVRLWYQLLPSNTPTIRTTLAGRQIPLSDELRRAGVSIEVLWPPAGLSAWKPNDRSLVLRLTIGGHALLLPGDIERDAMGALLESAQAGLIDLKADVLIAPHHGSIAGGVTGTFYAAVSPQVVIASSGRDRTKLTALIRETLGRACRVINTREVGAVVVRITPDGTLAVDTPYTTKRPILP